jgi:2-hydroxychromene-2-carboxylate isomerase
MAPTSIDFYFEFASPYGYLASTRIDALGERHGLAVRWHPIMLGAAFKETGARPLMHVPIKGPYLLHDVPRFARFLDVPFRMPPLETLPMRSLAAARACVWLDTEDPAKAITLAKAIYHAHWGEGRDLGDAEAVAGVAVGLGIPRDEVIAAVNAPAVKDELKARTDRAVARGVFGSPFIFVGEDPFWGADRLEQIGAWLTRGGW